MEWNNVGKVSAFLRHFCHSVDPGERIYRKDLATDGLYEVHHGR